MYSRSKQLRKRLTTHRHKSAVECFSTFKNSSSQKTWRKVPKDTNTPQTKASMFKISKFLAQTQDKISLSLICTPSITKKWPIAMKIPTRNTLLMTITRKMNVQFKKRTIHHSIKIFTDREIPIPTVCLPLHCSSRSIQYRANHKLICWRKWQLKFSQICPKSQHNQSKHRLTQPVLSFNRNQTHARISELIARSKNTTSIR